MAEIIKELKGHSASKVLLLQENNNIFVRKTGQIGRNIERFDALSNLKLPFPKIYEIYGDAYDMEYINSLDMKSYLTNHNPNDLINFIRQTIESLSKNTIEKDYSETYKNKLSTFDFDRYSLPFTMDELLDKLPKKIPSSEYHGDFTLENILYNVNKKEFVLIDPLTTEYNSYVFDLAKLHQDLTCKWFIRNENIFLDSKLFSIIDSLRDLFYDSTNYLIVLMLMRVLPYTQNKKDEQFLLNEVRRLWK